MTTTADLRAWIAALSAEDLEEVLSLREDALDGAPVRDLAELAERLAHPSAVATALADLPAPLAETLETLVACGAGATVGRAAELLDPTEAGGGERHREAVASAVRELTRAALVWPADPGAAPGGPRDTPPETVLALNPGLTAMVPFPWGLGQPVERLVTDVPAETLKRIVRGWGLPVPTRKADLVRAVREHLAHAPNVRMILATAEPGHAEVILSRVNTLARSLARSTHGLGDLQCEDPDEDEWQPAYEPGAYRREQAALSWARSHGLAYSPYGDAYGGYGVELPSEVVLALLPPGTHLPFRPLAPDVPSVAVTDEQARSAAAGAITETLAVTMSVLESLDRQPVTLLKGGGIGARELTRLAKNLGTGTTDVRLALEMASGLQLLGRVAESRVGTGAEFRTWRRKEPAQRAADLVHTWLGLPSVPTQERTEDGKSQPALIQNWTPRAPALRAIVLAQVSDTTNVGITSVDALADFVAWRLPFLAAGRFRDDVHATWSEAHRLGVLALGALTGPGRAVVAALRSGGRGLRTEALARSLHGMLPETQVRALFGSDLTIVVPGSPAHAVVDLLDTLADREARGSAATWRVTPDSVRRALDDGHEADHLLSRLRDLAAEPGLPQALEYLIRDVARRHGHLAVQPAGAVVVAQDAALVVEVAAHRALRRVGLRQVAPTVLVSQSSPEDVLLALRGAGYLPVLTDHEGARVVTVRPGTDVDDGAADPAADDAVAVAQDADDVLRQWAAEAGEEAGPPPEGAAALAARLMRGDPPPGARDDDGLAQAIARSARRLSALEVRQLAHAIATNGSVAIRYRSSSGGVTDRVISDLVLVGGYLHAWCHLRDADRYFALENILSVTPA